MNRSTVELDILEVHMDDLGDIVGEFYSTPIRIWHASDSRRREDADLILRLEYARHTQEVQDAVSF